MDGSVYPCIVKEIERVCLLEDRSVPPETNFLLEAKTQA